MANKQKPPKAKTRGSQKDHRADPARVRNPEQKLLRVLRSSGLQMAKDYAKHFQLETELEKPYFLEAVERYNRRKEDRRAGRSVPAQTETPPPAE